MDGGTNTLMLVTQATASLILGFRLVNTPIGLRIIVHRPDLSE